MTTSSQIPAALCGLYPGARATIISTPKNGVGTAGRRMEDGCWSVRFDSGDFGWWAPEVLSLLLDSPLALCHAARWLAARLGMEPGATAPPWFYDADAGAWVLHGMKTTVFFHGDSEGERRFFGRGRLVPDIHKVTDPAEALAAACVAVGGAS